MKFKHLLIIFFLMISMTSCSKAEHNKYNGTFEKIDSLEIDALNCDLQIDVDESIDDNILIDFNDNIIDSFYVDNNYSIKAESIDGKLLLKSKESLNKISIKSKVTNIKLYNIATDSLTINSEVAFSFIAATNINSLNFNISRSKGFYIHDSNIKHLVAKIEACELSSIHNNHFDTFEIENYRNDFKFSNSTFSKGTFKKYSGNLDIGLPANKGIYAEINCPDVLFDFETVSFNNKYYYLTPEYELYIENPNGAVSITRYFPE